MAKVIAAVAAAGLALPLLVILLFTATSQASAGSSAPASAASSGTVQDGSLDGAPTATARTAIPAVYLALYVLAARTCPGLPWSVLAGIGTVESGNGESSAAGVHSGANFAGAEGPMQFEPATFAEFAVNADPAEPLSPYDPADAIYTAAAMLCASGARGGATAGIETAVFAYNHASWYVSEVMAWAGKYASPQAASSGTGKAAAFAWAQRGKPCQSGADGPGSYDCPGLACVACAAAGIRTTCQWQQDGPVIPLTQIQPGDLLFSAGSDGTSASPGHVVLYLGGGQVIQAPQSGQDVQAGPADLASVAVATRPAAFAASS